MQMAAKWFNSLDTNSNLLSFRLMFLQGLFSFLCITKQNIAWPLNGTV